MIKQNQVVIVDYQMSNLFSVKHACDFVGLNSIISSDKKDLLSASAIILPGVGAFGDAMDNLKRLDLVNPIKDFIQSGHPFLGICLGMQLLFSESEEFGSHKGIDVIKGSVVRFPKHDKEGKAIKVPQIGWNNIYHPQDHKTWENSYFENVNNKEFMYFVHSYFVKPDKKDSIFSLTTYEEIEYCSALRFKNVFATQFHPEKSGPKGLLIYKNFAQSIS